MKQSNSVSLFTLIFWSLFFNAKSLFKLVIITIVIISIILFSSFNRKTNLTIGVVNLDKGITLQFSSEVLSFSNKIIEKLKNEGIKIIEYNNLTKSFEYLDKGKISLIIYFPENYTLFTHLSNFSKNNNVKPRILIYTNEKKYSKEIKIELFNAFSEMADSKNIPIEIVETITNKEIPKNYFFVISIFIFVFILSILSAYNFGFYLINKKYDQFLKPLNQSFLPIIIILSFLMSLFLFIINSVGFSLFTLIFKKVPFFGYGYFPVQVFLLSLSGSLIGFIISYLYKKINLFIKRWRSARLFQFG